jgi:hypothetical protein
VHRKDSAGKVQVITPALTDSLLPEDTVFVRESIF